eukprot:CAMPEP_0194397660 /NCGR_PEP_ID=MMETSP0174-20130528/125666_1 /TAXON_ID=216777 /ORGANISM="Proboscia alata, Strain PI-D3" /LENGTH=260 /DNA_ID=CAMNT_0039193861 /DNA_START=170 /DNA_END=952 /DNA_ORIENTATION=+
MFPRPLISIDVYPLLQSNIIDAQANNQEDIDISIYDISFNSCDPLLLALTSASLVHFTETSGTSASVSFFSDGGACGSVDSGALALTVDGTNESEFISATFSPTVAQGDKHSASGSVQVHQSFCLKAESPTADSTSITFPKVKVDVTFTYNSEGTFTLNMNATELATENTPAQGTKGTVLVAKHCLNDGIKDESISALSQGSTLRICLSPEDSSKVSIYSFNMNISPPSGSTSFTNEPIKPNGQALNAALTNIQSFEHRC